MTQDSKKKEKNQWNFEKELQNHITELIVFILSYFRLTLIKYIYNIITMAVTNMGFNY